MGTTNITDTLREIPTITCTLSVSFPDREIALNFTEEINLLTERKPRVFKPRNMDKWIVDVADINDKAWYLDEVVSKLFDSLENIKNQVKELIIHYHGETVIDIAVCETETYPALGFSLETIQNICLYSASVGIDLVY